MGLNCRKEPFVCIVNRTCIFSGYLTKDNKRNGYNDSQLPIRYNGWASKYIMEVTAMNKYVSLDKRSKKAQREYHTKQRRTWGELNPVTRSVPSGKTYNRKKEKQRLLRASGTCSATTEAKRRPAKSSEMDLMPIFFLRNYIFFA